MSTLLIGVPAVITVIHIGRHNISDRLRFQDYVESLIVYALVPPKHTAFSASALALPNIFATYVMHKRTELDDAFQLSDTPFMPMRPC